MSEFNKLRTPEYSEFIHKSRYARWIEKDNRRETWSETVTRVTAFWKGRFPDQSNDIDELHDSILDFEVMPSMRSLMTAGKALDRDNVAGFNCSAVAIDSPRSFDEIMYVLMCGTGLGFSVERQYIAKLPIIADSMHTVDTTITVRDSKIGWASAYKELIALLYSGSIPKWDISKVRPAGAKLKTFGGRASGPEPLVDLFNFTVEVFSKANGRKLNSIECHDLVCKIAEIVVVGGVRRSALISLSNLSDNRMSVAKSGQWWDENPQRALANNSVNYTEKPDMSSFIKEWTNLYESKSGERGIFSTYATNNLIPQRRKDLLGEEIQWLTNPCSEINLQSAQMCNLTEVIVRADDTLDTLLEKVRKATILGTLQSSLTDFRYLRKMWSDNCKKESLLGVSFTGVLDHPVLSGKEYLSGNNEVVHWLNTLRDHAVETNKEWAEILGVNPSTAITCNKPSGTVSQLTDTASGIHPRYSKYYIRTVRGDIKDPLTQLMIDQGVPNEPCVMKPDSTVIFSFPIESPDTSVFRDDRNAIEQLEIWKLYQLEWCEHKPSVTIYVKEHEWLQVAAWVYENFNIVSGVSFLPHSEHSYKQAPYQEITKEQYEEARSNMVQIDWETLSRYEKEDKTTGTKELACTGGSCEIV